MDAIGRRRVALATILSLFLALGPIGPVESAEFTHVALLTARQTVGLQGEGKAQFEASGEGRFRGEDGPLDGQALLTTEGATYAFRFLKARIIQDATGTPLGLALSGRGQVDRGGRQESFEVTASVRPDTEMAECLIYDILGPDVKDAPVKFHFEADGTLRISR